MGIKTSSGLTSFSETKKYWADGIIKDDTDIAELICWADGVALPTDASIIGTGSVTITLPDGVDGDVLYLILYANGSGLNVTVNGNFRAGMNQAVFEDYAQALHLVWASGHWSIASNVGNVRLLEDGAPYLISQATSTIYPQWPYVNLDGYYEATLTLPDGEIGDELLFEYIDEDNTVTLTPATFVDGTSITFDADNEYVVLRWLPNGWNIVTNTATLVE